MHRNQISALSAVVFASVLGISMKNAAAQTLTQGEFLFPGQQIMGSQCYFYTTMQPDGNLVTYDRPNPSATSAWWATGTEGRGGYAVLQGDGNFVIYNWQDEAVWATGTDGTFPYQGGSLTQEDSGQLVVANFSGYQLWGSDAFIVGGAPVVSGCQPNNVATIANQDSSNLSGPPLNYISSVGGSIYSTFTLAEPRASWCGYYCSQDSRCNSYTYTPPSTCSLIDVSPPFGTLSEGSVSGSIVRLQ